MTTVIEYVTLTKMQAEKFVFSDSHWTVVHKLLFKTYCIIHVRAVLFYTCHTQVSAFK